MSLFSDFEEEEIILLVSLPYRVGLWVSHADDDASTEYDDVQEAKALERVLKDIAKDKSKPFAASIVQETLKYPDHWGAWGKQLDDVIQDTKKANAMITARMPEEEAQNYRKSLLDVARTVALAFGEHAGDAHDLTTGSGLGGLIGKIKSMAGTAPSDDPDNISPAEQAALDELERNLGTL